MAKVKTLDVLLRANVDAFLGKLGLAGSALKTFGKVGSSVGGFGLNAIAGAAGVAATGVAVFAGGVLAAGAALTALAGSQLLAVDELSKTADKLGIATESLASFRLAAEQTGTSAETLEASMGRMERSIFAASQGTGPAVKAFAALHVNVQELVKQRGDTQFYAIADAISKVQNPSQKAALAVQIFGKGAQSLLPLLNQGAEGLEEFADKAEAMGLAIGEDQTRQIREANDSLNLFKNAVAGVGRTLAIIAAPWVKEIGVTLTEFAVAARQKFIEWQPVLEAFWATFKQGLVTGWEIAKITFEGIMGGIRAILRLFGVDLGDSFENGQQVIINALEKLEFGIAHWKEYMHLAVLKGQLSWESFKENVVNLFVNVLPTVLENSGKIILTIMKNLGMKMADNWELMLEVALDPTKAGKLLNVDWTANLTKGAEAQLQKIKQSMVRPLSDAERSLMDQIKSAQDQLDGEWDDFVDDKLDQLNKTRDALKEDAAENMDLLAAASHGTVEAMAKGSAAAFSAIHNYAEGGGLKTVAGAVNKGNAINQRGFDVLADKLDNLQWEGADL